jgi:Fur family ferric uptake transcriptional regulator
MSEPHGHAHIPPRGPAELRSQGRRLTRQRALIWAVLTAEPDRHLAAAEVAERVRGELPRVNSSTIYRTLELLVDEGLVLRTDLGAGRVFYEPAHDHPHHHVVCRGCGAVAHLHEEVLGDLRARVAAASGFMLGEEELTLFGRCPGCSPSIEGGLMSDHDHTHDHPHTHAHTHGDVRHSHPHTTHDHEHVEHEHEHRHGDLVHSHPHTHEAGHEHDDAHAHEH